VFAIGQFPSNLLQIGSPDQREGPKMRRREFIAGLGSAAALPVVARGQQQPQRLLTGRLSSRTQREDSQFVERLPEGLRQTGFIEGSNLTIEYRWANDDSARLPLMAVDLVRRNVAVIVAGGLPAAQAAKAATDSIPIVFITGADPVKFGLVVSLSRPGGKRDRRHQSLRRARLEALGDHARAPACRDRIRAPG
jgi:putative ABC transport system substrate-binding protein